MLGRANYVDFKQLCLAKSNSQDHLCIEAGNPKVFSFEFQLPLMIPTSFESKRFKGHIRYWVQGVIDIPWSFNRYTHTTFTVINTLDLRSAPSLFNPIGVSDRKFYCCGPCQSSPVEISFNANKCKKKFK